MYCRKCGNELKEDDLFCNKCGNKVEQELDTNNNSVKKEIEFEKKTNMNIYKKILLISVCAFILSIILGNIFNAIDFQIGKYISMGILYVSIGTGIISLIGYFFIKKDENEKMPIWITVLIGIIIALVVANTISSIFDYSQKQKTERYMNAENSTLVDLKKNANDKLEEYEKKYGVDYQEHIIESDDILTVISEEKVATYREFVNICEEYGEALVGLKNYGYFIKENSFVVYLKVEKSRLEEIFNKLTANEKVFKVVKGYLVTYDIDNAEHNENEIWDFELERRNISNTNKNDINLLEKNVKERVESSYNRLISDIDFYNISVTSQNGVQKIIQKPKNGVVYVLYDKGYDEISYMQYYGEIAGTEILWIDVEGDSEKSMFEGHYGEKVMKPYIILASNVYGNIIDRRNINKTFDYNSNIIKSLQENNELPKEKYINSYLLKVYKWEFDSNNNLTINED